MALAPPSAITACLGVLEDACIQARLLAWKGSDAGLSIQEAELLADLMDAVHNLPHLVQHWERGDEELLRGTLDDFDNRHGGQKPSRLLELYDRLRSIAV